MQVKNKNRPSLKKRIKSKSPSTTLLFVHPAEISTYNNTIKLSYIKFLGAFFKMGGGEGGV